MLKGFVISVLLIAFLKSHSHDTKFYDTLGIKFNATEEEVKAAYLELSKKHHPDRSRNSSAFIRIKRAYEVLSDRARRHIYDTDGPEEVKNYEQALRGGYVDQRYNKLRPKTTNIFLNLEDVYKGADKEFTISRNSTCKQCKGTGAKDGKLKICSSCDGKGTKIEHVRTGFGMMRMQTRCNRCGGQGKFAAARCPHCSGRRLAPETKKFKVSIERGAAHGDTVIFRGQGDAVIEALPGDLIFNIRVKNHKTFKRRGDDLFTSVNITFKEAVFGFERFVRHLDGREVKVKREGVSQPNSVIKLEGEGMPVKGMGGNFGDMHVEVRFHLPFSVSEPKKEILKMIFE